MENGIDDQYINLLKDILENGVKKETRNGGTLSVFGRTIKYKFKDGKFPLITTKKMYMKGIITELIWFLRGETNIKYLVDNDCHIWDGDAYKSFEKWKLETHSKIQRENPMIDFQPLEYETKEEFINKIKTDDEFANKWGSLGKIYGHQWRNWDKFIYDEYDRENKSTFKIESVEVIDQISELIRLLKETPDSRRMVVNAWNVADLEDAVLPPCHYAFQCYTRELSDKERVELYEQKTNTDTSLFPVLRETLDFHNIPTRAISLMWSQRSCDFPLGIPYNIGSYALLLEILGKVCNMIPDELIGNLGDCHIYLNQIDGVKEQIGREYTSNERVGMLKDAMSWRLFNKAENEGDDMSNHYELHKIPKYTRYPYPLPTLKHMKTDDFYKSLSDDISLLYHLDNTDFQIENYQSHPTIKIPLSN
jgi:thymidylate synthase